MSDTLVQLVCLPLYSETAADGRFVPFRNSLNMWNASGRPRHEDEIGIPVPIEFRNRYPDFFPGVSVSFDLKLPNFTILTAKQCQQGGKALMSNPNRDLGKWLLRDILHIPKYKVVTYTMLQEVGIDSVYVEKWSHGGNYYYKIFPAPLNEYDRFIRGAKLQRSAPVAGRPTAQTVTSATPTNPVSDHTANAPLPVIEKGDSIEHIAYGHGTVISVKNNLVEIDFSGTKKKLQYAWLIKNNCLCKK